MCLCSRVRHNNIAISLPALLFFRSYNEVFVQTTFIPYYLSTDIDFVCVLCTSSSTAAVSSPSPSLSLCVFVPGYLTQQYRHFSTYPFIFSQLQRSVCTNGICSLLPFWHVLFFDLCDDGPDSLHAVIRDKITFSPLTGGCGCGKSK